MELTWYGHASFRLVPDTGPTVITDPYNPELIGYAPFQHSSDVVIISSDDDEGHCRADLVPGAPKVVNALTVALEGGTTEVEGLSISAIEAAEWEHHPTHEVPGQNGMYRFTLDGITFAHMGDVGNALTDAQISFFEDVDVLFALAGGYLTIQLPDLMAMIHRMRPKLVVPMHFRTLAYRPRDTFWIESFTRHFLDDAVDFACEHTVKLTAGGLPATTRVLVLDYLR